MRKILLIEDDEMFSKSLRLAMEREGYEVNCAYNGQTGLEMARLHRPDILLPKRTPEVPGWGDRFLMPL